jgi:hypothetical protein
MRADLFVRLVDRQRHREAVTSRPMLLGGMARQTKSRSFIHLPFFRIIGRNTFQRDKAAAKSVKAVEAGRMIATQPTALQLRFLQTMREISAEHSTIICLPLPIELFTAFLKRGCAGEA